MTRSEHIRICAEGHALVDGVRLDPAGLAQLQTMLAALEPAIEALYHVCEASDESPGTVFAARPPAERWHG